MSDNKEDFHPEPTQECRICGEPWLVTELDENGLCLECSINLEDEEEADA